MELGAGTVLLGRYRLDRQLGVGGMGTVWQATDLLLKRDVAVKLMAPQLRSDPVSWERFRREAQYQAALRHPGITEVYDYGEHEGQPFIVMEFLDGSDLYTLLRANPRGLPVNRAAGLALQAADAVAYLHDSGILHRDIKPANLFLAHDGQLKVCDFGVAKSVGSASITHAGVRLGTWAYLAPEVWLGEEATASTDLYALGCVLHEMLTGQPPFSVLPDEAAVRQAHLRDQVPPPRGEHPIPERLATLVSELLSKDPQARPATARDVAEELRAVTSAPDGAEPGDGPLIPSNVPGASLPPDGNPPADGSPSAGGSRPAGGNPQDGNPPAGGSRWHGGNGTAAAATIPRTRELPPDYYQAAGPAVPDGPAGAVGAVPQAAALAGSAPAGTAVLDGAPAGSGLAGLHRASPALADGHALAVSGQPRGDDGVRLWTSAARVSAWVVFATMVVLCAAIAAGHLAPEYRLFVLVPAAIYTLPGAVAVSRATFSRASSGSASSGSASSGSAVSGSAVSGGAVSGGAVSGSAMSGTASSGSASSGSASSGGATSSRVGPAATVFVSLWISEAAAILVASHVRPAEGWSAVMVLSWLIGISTAAYYSS